MAKYSLADNPLRGRVEDFDRESCCKFRCAAVGPMAILVAGYNRELRDPWENCLTRKWSVGDCVAGCHNDDYGNSKHYGFNRNSHQYCISNKAVLKAVEVLENAEISDADTRSFEDFYAWVGRTLKANNVKGLGNLSIYDIALRMGWNFDSNGSPRRIEPSKYVYLHQGALWGAQALARISRHGKKYLNPNVELESCVKIKEFSPELRSLGANHLENFLCIFHNLFTCWADGLDMQAAERDRKEAAKKEKQNKTDK